MINVIRGPTTEPLRILVHGVEGVGKTTFAASAPNAIFLSPEDGGGDLDYARVPIDSWQTALSALDSLAREPHDFQTVVVDTIDYMERLCWAHLVGAQHGATTIEEVGGGYGKGYTAAVQAQSTMLGKLDILRSHRKMAVILLAHTTVKVFNDPEGPPYDRYQIAMNEKAAKLWLGWCDDVLFANYDVRVSQRTGAKPGEKAKVRNEIPDRVLYAEHRAAYDAKNRHSLPSEMPLSWAEFSTAIRWAERVAATAARPQTPTPIPTIEDVRQAAGHAMRDLDWLQEDVAALLRQHGAADAKAAGVPEASRSVVIDLLSVSHSTEAK